MILSVRWLYPTAFWCLLISGIAGLLYQVAWARYLSILLGNTSYGVVAVLVAFMGGLALGNAWLGRYADKLKRPLALYAWLEIGIAVYGIFFPHYFEVCRGMYTGIAGRFEPGSPWLLALKFLFGGVVILVPATLMGGTLPILTRLVTRSLGELRGRVASLYFVNSLGAVLGVVIGDFWWIPSHGLEVTILGAAALNAWVGIVALFVHSGLRGIGTLAAATADESSAPRGPAEDESFSPFDLRLAVAAAGVSGFVAMLYEVVWTRLLALALGSSTHAFSIMLATFIAGIATGAWIVGRWRGLRKTFDAFGWVELALALTLLASMSFYHLLPYGFYRLGTLLSRTPENHPVYQLLQFGVCFAVMFVPAVLLGMTLPLASRVATSELARTGRSVGVVFSVNTVGTVLGAALSGLVLLPWLGLASTFAFGLALNLAIAVVVLVRRTKSLRLVAVAGVPVLVALLVAYAQTVLDPKWDRAFSLGLWRFRGKAATLDEYLASMRRIDLRYHKDGSGSTVAVIADRARTNQAEQISLRVNGKTDASSHGDLPTQLLSGHIPLLLHTNASEVLVVGIGSGITCAAVLSHPDVRQLDVVEISPEVHHAARTYFAPYNDRALDDPRTRVVLDDAKSFLAAADRRYDVIVTEPSNPWMAGVSGVFSMEYYETCRASLKPGGIVAQWVQVYETDDEALQTVLGTFGSAFPRFSVWQTLPGDLLLIGSSSPIANDLDAIERRFRQPTVLRNIQRADVFALPALLALQLVSEENGTFLVAPDTLRHSDFFPRLEYLAERAFFAQGETAFLAEFDERFQRRPTTLLARYLERTPLTVHDARSVALLHASAGVPHPRIVRSVLRRWRDIAPDDLLPVELASKLDFPLPDSALQAAELERSRELLFARSDSHPEPIRMYSRYLQNAYRHARTVFYQPSDGELRAVLEHLAEKDEVHRASHLLRLAELAWDHGDDGRFVQLATRALLSDNEGGLSVRFDFDYSSPSRVLVLLIETLWRRGQLEDARWWCDAVRRGGYLDEKNRYYSRRLSMVVRKVEFEQASETAPRDVRPSPTAGHGAPRGTSVRLRLHGTPTDEESTLVKRPPSG
ncbi:MAG: fused MFS/spermidine synthase [Verrucomicrobiales bacterium]|nr:fused MFS/spermidine synthase [Verrucomicrobiales bacterium]